MTKEETIQYTKQFLADAEALAKEVLLLVRKENPDLILVWTVANQATEALNEALLVIDECEEE